MRERMLSQRGSDADLLRCAPGAKWLHIGGVRYSGSAAPEPIALVDIYVEATYGQLKGLAKTLDVPVHTMIEEQYGIKVTRVEQELHGAAHRGGRCRGAASSQRICRHAHRPDLLRA